jgi:hypothetical protein
MGEAIELITGRAVPLVLTTSRSAHINFCINILKNDEWVVSSKLFAWNLLYFFLVKIEKTKETK